MRAMRSNIARTCVSGSVPDAGVPPLIWSCASSGLGPVGSGSLLLALERRYVLDELVELLGVLPLERRIGRHRRGRVYERARDCVRPESSPYLGQVGSDGVAVLADLVAAEASRGGRDLLSLLVLRRHCELDLGGRAGE